MARLCNWIMADCKLKIKANNLYCTAGDSTLSICFPVYEGDWWYAIVDGTGYTSIFDAVTAFNAKTVRLVTKRDEQSQ